MALEETTLSAASRKQDSGSGYVPSLSGLRGIAALMVLFSHFSNATDIFGGTFGSGAGQLGVILFFLLSAFLMMFMYHEAPRAPLHFLWNRFARVYPLFAAVVLVSLVLGAVLPWSNYLRIDSGNVVQALFFYNGNVVLWSIGPEIVFYCVFAVLLLLPRVARTGVIIAGAVAALATWTLIDRHNWVADLGVHGNLADQHHVYKVFVLGLACYLLARVVPEISGLWARLATVVLVVAALTSVPNLFLATFGTWPGHSGWNEPFTVITFCLILLGTIKLAPMRAFLSHPWLLWLGEVSFSLYLLHGFVLALFKERDWMHPTPFSLAGVLVCSLALSWVVNRGFEKPTRKLLRALPGRVRGWARRPQPVVEAASPEPALADAK